MQLSTNSYYSIKDRLFYTQKGSNINSSSIVNTYSKVISTLNMKNFFYTLVEVDEDLLNNELITYIEFTALNQLNLNIQKEYIIDYVKKDKNRYDVFVASKVYLENNLLNKRDKFNIVIPSPLIFGAMYESSILAKRGVDCFIYFGEDESFYSIYKDGQFYSYSELDFSLRKIHKSNFADLRYEEFCTLLVEDKINLDYFSNTVLNELQVSLAQVKNRFEISKFENIFVDSDCNMGKSVYKNALNILNEDVKKIGFDSKILGIDALGALSLLYLKNISQKSNKYINFATTLNKNDYFTSFIASIVIGIAISISYPSYQYYKSIQLKKSISQKSVKISNTSDKIDKYINNIKLKQSSIKKLNSKILDSKLDYNELIKSVESLELFISNKNSSKILVQLTQGLNISRVNLKDINIQQNEYNSSVELNIYAKNQHEIAKFLKSIQSSSENIYVTYLKKSKYHYEAKIEVLM